ncbi:hypothetical protein LSH36_136g02046, partial [Paralvinella palmiformis]
MLNGRPVTFEPLEDGPPPQKKKRYVIVGVPLEVYPDYFIGLHHITKAVRITKGGTPTTCMVLTTTRPPPEKIRIGFGPHLTVIPYVPDPPQCYRCYRWGHVAKSCRYGPRCYHCGRGYKKTTPCPAKPVEPVYLNRRQKHATAYRGCHSGVEQVTSAQLRLGVTPRPKASPIATTPASSNPWNRTAQLARATLPATLLAASHPLTKTVSQDYNLTTDFPELPSVTQETTPVSIQRPSTPPTNRPETNMASVVAAIMAHMSHIWSIMNKVTELIKILPDDLKKDAAFPKRRPPKNHRGDSTADCAGRTPQASILKWNTRRADWVKYSQTLQTLTPDILPNIDLDIHLDTILEAVQSAADISVPRHTEPKHDRRTNYIPSEGKIYTRQLSMATKAFKLIKTDESKQEIRTIQKIAKYELHKLQTKAWDDWCEKLSTMNTNRLWSEIRKLKGSTKQVTTRNPKEEADTLAKHFATRAASHTLPLRIQQELRDRHEERSSALPLTDLSP